MINGVITGFLYITFLTISLCAQSPEQNPRLRQVMVKTEVSRGAEYPLKVKGVLLVESEPEVVWGVLTDYEHLEGVFPGLVKSQVLTRDGGEVVVEQQYRGLIFLSRSMVFVSREDPMRRIDFRRLKGKSSVAGYWSLEPVAGGFTRLGLEVAVRPRWFLPLWVVGGMLKDHIPQGLLSIRQKSLIRLNKSDPEDPEIIYLEEGHEERSEEVREDNPSQEGF